MLREGPVLCSNENNSASSGCWSQVSIFILHVNYLSRTTHNSLIHFSYSLVNIIHYFFCLSIFPLPFLSLRYMVSQAVWSECRRRWEQIVKGKMLQKLTVLYAASTHIIQYSNTDWLRYHFGPYKPQNSHFDFTFQCTVSLQSTMTAATAHKTTLIMTSPIQITSLCNHFACQNSTKYLTPLTKMQRFVDSKKKNIIKFYFQFEQSLITVMRCHEDIKSISRTDHRNLTELNGNTRVNSLCVWEFMSQE